MADDIVATITLLAIDRASETIARVGESAKAAGAESEAGFAGFLGSAAKLTGVLAIAGAVAEGFAIKTGASFQSALDKVEGFAGASAQQMERYKKSILDTNVALGSSATSMADGLYFVVSAGFKGQAAMDVLKASTMAASASGSDFKTVADGVTTALNAYHMSGTKATQVTDILSATVVHGKMEWQDLAGSIGKMLPIAAGAGVTLSEAGGAMATLTEHGYSARLATMGLRSVFMDLLAPNTALQKAATGLGADWHTLYDVHGKGLIATLQGIDQLAHKNASSTMEYHQNLKDLLGTQAAVAAFLAIAADGFGSLKRNVDAAKDSTGTTARAFDLHMKTMEGATSKLWAAVQDLGIAFGTPLLGPISRAEGEVTKFVQYVTQHAPEIQAAISRAFSTIEVTVAPVLSWLQTNIPRAFDWLRTNGPTIFDAVKQDITSGVQAIKGLFSSVSGVIGQFGNDLQRASQHGLAFRRDFDQIKSGFGDLVTAIGTAFAPLGRFSTASGDAKQHADALRTSVQIAGQVIAAAVTDLATVVVTQFHLIMDAFSTLVTLASDVAKLIANYFSDVATVFGDVVTTIDDLVHGRWSKIMGDLGKFFGDQVKVILDLANNIKQIFQDLLGSVERTVGDLTSGVGQLFSQLVSQVTSALGGLNSEPIATITHFVSTAKSTMQQLGSAFSTAATEAVSKVWDALKDLMGGPISAIAQFVKAGLDEINKLTGGSVGKFLQMVQGVLQHVGNLKDQAGGLIGGMWHGITSQFDSGGQHSTATTHSMAAGVSGGMASMSSAALAHVQTFTSGTTSHFQDMQKQAHATTLLLMSTVVDNFKTLHSHSVTQVTQMASKIQTEMHTLGNQMQSAAKTAGSQVTSALESMAHQGEGTVRGMVSAIRGILQSLVGIARASGAAAGAAFASGLSSQVGAVSAAAESLVAAARAHMEFHSPNRFGVDFEVYGRNAGLGFAKGLRSTTSYVAAAAAAVILAATGTMASTAAAAAPAQNMAGVPPSAALAPIAGPSSLVQSPVESGTAPHLADPGNQNTQTAPGAVAAILAGLGPQIQALSGAMTKLPPAFQAAGQQVVASYQQKVEVAYQKEQQGIEAANQKYVQAQQAANQKYQQSVSTAEEHFSQRRQQIEAGANQQLNNYLVNHGIRIDAAHQHFLEGLSGHERQYLTERQSLEKQLLSAKSDKDRATIAEHIQKLDGSNKAFLSQKMANEGITNKEQQQILQQWVHNHAAVLNQHIGNLRTTEENAISKASQARQAALAKSQAEHEAAIKKVEGAFGTATEKLKAALQSAMSPAAIVASVQKILDANLKNATDQLVLDFLEVGQASGPAVQAFAQSAAASEQLAVAQQQAQQEALQLTATAAEAAGDFKTALNDAQQAAQNIADQAFAQLTIAIMRNAGDQDQLAQKAAQAAQQVEAYKVAQQQAQEAVDRAMGHFSSTISDLSNKLSGDLQNALDKYTYDLLNNSGNLDQDTQAIAASQEAQQKLTDAQLQAQEAAAKLSGSFATLQQTADTEANIALEKLAMAIMNGDTPGHIQQLAQAAQNAANKSAAYAAAMETAKAMLQPNTAATQANTSATTSNTGAFNTNTGAVNTNSGAVSKNTSAQTSNTAGATRNTLTVSGNSAAVHINSLHQQLNSSALVGMRAAIAGTTTQVHSMGQTIHTVTTTTASRMGSFGVAVHAHGQAMQADAATATTHASVLTAHTGTVQINAAALITHTQAVNANTPLIAALGQSAQIAAPQITANAAVIANHTVKLSQNAQAWLEMKEKLSAASPMVALLGTNSQIASQGLAGLPSKAMGVGGALQAVGQSAHEVASQFDKLQNSAQQTSDDALKELAQKIYDMKHGIEDTLPPLATLQQQADNAARSAQDFADAVNQATAAVQKDTGIGGSSAGTGGSGAGGGSNQLPAPQIQMGGMDQAAQANASLNDIGPAQLAAANAILSGALPGVSLPTNMTDPNLAASAVVHLVNGGVAGAGAISQQTAGQIMAALGLSVSMFQGMGQGALERALGWPGMQQTGDVPFSGTTMGPPPYWAGEPMSKQQYEALQALYGTPGTPQNWSNIVYGSISSNLMQDPNAAMIAAFNRMHTTMQTGFDRLQTPADQTAQNTGSTATSSQQTATNTEQLLQQQIAALQWEVNFLRSQLDFQDSGLSYRPLQAADHAVRLARATT